MWPEGGRCRTAREKPRASAVQAGPVPVPEFRWRIRVRAAPGGMAPLEVRASRLRPAVQLPRMSPASIAGPASAGAAGSPRNVSPLNIRPLGFKPVGAGWDVPGFPVRPSTRGGPLSLSACWPQRRQALRGEPRLRPAFGCRRRGPARTFGSGGSRDLPGTCASPPPRWFAAGRVDALRGRFA